MPNLTTDQTVKVLTDVARVVTSSTYTLVAGDIALPASVQMKVVKRGTCTFTCGLEYSYDGTNWTSQGTVSTDGTVTLPDTSGLYVRVNVSAFTAAAPGNSISVSLRAYGVRDATLNPTRIRVPDGFGGYVEFGCNSELITLSTSGVTTDSVANLLPANSLIQAVTGLVTTSITTATDWSLGIAGTAARFAAANSTMTAGATSVGLAHWAGTVAIAQVAAAKVRITTTLTPAAGVIRVSVYYRTYVPSVS